jgi:carboxymethylenebutenolidase
MAPDQLTDKFPASPLDFTKDLSCPILGLFGEQDTSPTPEQVKLHEEELKKHGKIYEFHMFPNAGHGFFITTDPTIVRNRQSKAGRWSLRFLKSI